LATTPHNELIEDDLWEHQEASKKLTALYANRIFAQPLGEGVLRVNFGEMTETIDPSYHSAIVVTPELALEFADVIFRVATELLRAQQERADREALDRLEKQLAAQAGGASGAAEGAAQTDGD
jgi:hypothetical protein